MRATPDREFVTLDEGETRIYRASNALLLCCAPELHFRRCVAGGFTLPRGLSIIHRGMHARSGRWLKSTPRARYSSARAKRPRCCRWPSPIVTGLSPARPAPARPSPCRFWPKASRAPACRFSQPTSRAICRASAPVGEAKEALVKRAKDLGFDYQPDEFPAVFWDVFGEQGHPVRATISEMGPLLLSRHDGSQRRAGRRAQHRVPRRRRAGAAAARSQGPARDPRPSGGARRRAHHAIRQRLEGDHRHDPAPAAGAGEPGRHQILRRAGARR